MSRSSKLIEPKGGVVGIFNLQVSHQMVRNTGDNLDLQLASEVVEWGWCKKNCLWGGEHPLPPIHISAGGNW